MQTQTSTELHALQRAVAGRYTIDREIGRGGMGVVFLARDVALERPVAIKLLPPAFAAQPTLRERFLREARTAAALSHPNIVPIHAVEEHGDLVFFVMGYVEGETLARRVSRTGPLPPADAARILQEVAWALAYSHGRGVVHRDVKPDNILIEVGSGRAMVTDFGIARQAANGGLTEVGHVVGTPQYMSPEQAAGEELDGRSDLYSLGIVGFFALTGRVPFDGPNAAQILSQHLTQPAPPVASVRQGVPRTLADAVDRCLSKQREERFATGEELGAAVGVVQERDADVAPQVRNFMRYAEMATMTFYIFLVFSGVLLLEVRERRSNASLFGLVGGLSMGLLALTFDLLGRARRVLRHGFTFEDVRAGFAADLRAREREVELSQTLTEEQRRRRLVYALLVCVTGAWGLAAGSLARTFTDAGTPERQAVRVVMIVSLFLLAAGYMAALLGNTKVERRSASAYVRLWSGWFGRAFFALARWRLPATRVQPISVTLTQLVEEVVHALPRSERARGRAAVDVVRRIEAGVEALRRRESELDGLLAEAGADRLLREHGTAARDVATTGERESFDQHRLALVRDLQRTRDETASRRATVNAALEAIRVQLLRVRGGLASLDDVLRDAESVRAIAEGTAPVAAPRIDFPSPGATLAAR